MLWHSHNITGYEQIPIQPHNIEAHNIEFPFRQASIHSTDSTSYEYPFRSFSNILQGSRYSNERAEASRSDYRDENVDIEYPGYASARMIFDVGVLLVPQRLSISMSRASSQPNRTASRFSQV